MVRAEEVLLRDRSSAQPRQMLVPSTGSNDLNRAFDGQYVLTSSGGKEGRYGGTVFRSALGKGSKLIQSNVNAILLEKTN